MGAGLTNGGTLTNGSAAITGRLIGGDADGVLMINDAGTVANFGTITGTSDDGIRIENYGGGSDLVENGASGTITGKVGISVGSSATITNAGTITGTGGTAIQFGNGNDTLVLDAGAVFNGSSMAVAERTRLNLAPGSE